MESDIGSDVDNMTIQPQTRHCKGGPEACSTKKQNPNWTKKAWIWRMSNAAMVVFFVSAAYVQVCTVYRVIHTTYTLYTSVSYFQRRYHRPLKIRTDGSHARVRELGSIDIFLYFYYNFNYVKEIEEFFA